MTTAFVLACLCAVSPVEEPAEGDDVADASVDETAAEETGDPVETTETTETAEMLVDVQQHQVEQQFAVPEQVPMPVPSRRTRDKKLRQDRGMLAAGIVFAAVCGTGAGLAAWVIVDNRNGRHGQDSADAIGAFTGMLSCTVGALALASAGALGLKRRRGR